MNFDGLISIAFGLVAIGLRRRGAEETRRFWGTPSQKERGVTRNLELFQAFVGLCFVLFGLIRLFSSPKP